MAENTGMSDLVVNRWRRYGKDRLYVQTLDGSKVGFWDLTDDTAHPEEPEHLDRLTEVATAWKAAQGDTSSEAVQNDAAATPAVVHTPEPTPVVVEMPVPVPVIPVPLPDLAPEPEPEPAPTEPSRPWIDLATNRPGAEAREQALAARDAAPVRTTLARVLGVHTNERAWRIGADGEEKVADQLAKAAKKDPRWLFLHAIPVGDRGSDIDHLIIGPGGVFTVNTKHHPGANIWVGGSTFMVNGTRQPYVRNARHEAERASRLLTAACGFHVHAAGLIVTVNASDVVVKSQPQGVSVVPRMQVAKWLLRHGPVYAESTIAAIYDAARRSTTWTRRG